MSNLETIVKECLNIPCVKEGQAIMDGSFILSPYMANSLRGSGSPQSISLSSSIDLFYTSKEDAVEQGLKLFTELCSTSGVSCQEPDFTYENEAHYWRTTLLVQEVIK